MTGKPLDQLTAADKILLHLRDYWLASSKLEFPANITQKGIAQATGLVLTHIPRALKRLNEDGLVREVSGHIEGERRRYKAYFLTEEGMRRAQSVRAELLESEVRVKRADREWPVKLGEALELSSLSLAEVLKQVSKGKPLDLSGSKEAVPASPPMSMLDDAPPLSAFLDREEERRHMEGLYEGGKARLILVVGGLGIGKTALVRQFVEARKARESAIWINLHRSSAPEKVAGAICKFLKSGETMPQNSEACGRKLAKLLDAGQGLIILDDYYEVPEATVELFQALVSELKPGPGARLMMTLREDTPSYNRFYGRREMDSGAVEEIHLRGMSLEDSRTMLGAKDIDADAMKRIYLFTKGSPQTLKLLADGDIERLRQTTRFTNEEIRLLLFLKTVKASR